MQKRPLLGDENRSLSSTPLEVQHVSQYSGNEGIHFTSIHVTFYVPPMSNFRHFYLNQLVFILEKNQGELDKRSRYRDDFEILIKKNRIQNVNLQSTEKFDKILSSIQELSNSRFKDQSINKTEVLKYFSIEIFYPISKGDPNYKSIYSKSHCKFAILRVNSTTLYTTLPNQCHTNTRNQVVI